MASTWEARYLEEKREYAAKSMARPSVALGLKLHGICCDEENAPSAAEMQSFITGGADVNTCAYFDEYALMQEFIAGEIDDINDFTDEYYKKTVLTAATHNGYLEAVKMLLTIKDIDINSKESDFEETALMHACRKDRTEIVKVLLEAHKKRLYVDFDVNFFNDWFETSLMHACKHGNLEIIKLLLSIPHINTHLKCSTGTTALDHAKGTGHRDATMVLFQGELLFFQLQIKSDNLHSFSSFAHAVFLSLLSLFNRSSSHFNLHHLIFHIHFSQPVRTGRRKE
jgi:ankyrin repeat protein